MKKYTFLIWGLIILGLIGVVLAMYAIVTHKSSSKSNLGYLIKAVDANDFIRGPQDAKVVLVEYSDFQCSACSYYYSQLKQLEKDFDGKIAVVYRHFPLEQIHSYARLAARAAEAAGKQGKFWEMHDWLFENQNTWSSSADANSLFISSASALKLDIDKFIKDLGSLDIDEKINKDYQSGIVAGVQGTPTFFVNGKQIENPINYDAFKAIIQQELNK